jgi:DNA-binding NarL/FixJ family response regulator
MALVVDDQRIAGEAMAALLSEVFGLEILAICSTTSEACSWIRRQPPQLLVLDAEHGEDNCRKATELLTALNPMAEFLFHTKLAKQFTPPNELAGSTIGVLDKSDGLDGLLELIQPWWNQKYENICEYPPGCEKQIRAIQTLSPRENQLLLEIGNGRLNKQISISLGITTATVESYRKNIAVKLGVSGAELVRLAVIYRALRWCHNIGQAQQPKPEP